MIDETFIKNLNDLKVKKAHAKYNFNKKDLLRHTILAQIISIEKLTTKTLKEAENNARMSKTYIDYIEDLATLQLKYDLLNAEVQGMELQINIYRDKQIAKATELKHQNLIQI